jgi:predicted Zn-dependent protease with MMP-like domain
MHLSRREFAALVREAYQQLPLKVQQALDNVDILVEDRPGPDDLELLGEEGTLFGLYTGVPLTHREGGGPALPDRIILYRQPISQSCSSADEVVREVKVTLWHEVGHFLGLDEEDLHRLGYG